MSKLKTDWGLVINLLCIGALGCMVCFIGNYIDMQAKRIDYLEIENIKHREALHVHLPSARERNKEYPSIFEGLGIGKDGKPTAGTDWHNKEH